MLLSLLIKNIKLSKEKQKEVNRSSRKYHKILHKECIGFNETNVEMTFRRGGNEWLLKF